MYDATQVWRGLQKMGTFPADKVSAPHRRLPVHGKQPPAKSICRRLDPNTRASLVAQMVNSLPAAQETRVQSLGREDPLEKDMATHSSTLAWNIPCMKDPGGLRSVGAHRVGYD